MKTIIETIFPETKIVTGVTGICQIDGPFTILDVQSPYVAIRFHQTGNTRVLTETDVVHDEWKRRKSKSPEYWFSVAIALEGFIFPNGRKIVDVRSANRVLLEDGGYVKIDYCGEEPKVRDRSAHAKWHHILANYPGALCDEWQDFQQFQDWYIENRPATKRKWSLRSVDGTWSPATCGFDDRTDLPVSSAVLIDSVFTR